MQNQGIEEKEVKNRSKRKELLGIYTSWQFILKNSPNQLFALFL